MISIDKIISVESYGDFTTAIHVQYGEEIRTYYKDVPYSILRDVILARKKEELSTSDASIARNLEQLAKYQQSFAG
jgi:hypothetical protein